VTEQFATNSYVKDTDSLRAIREAADLPTERARNNQATLTFRGRRIHSSVDPEAEARLFVDEHREELQKLLLQETSEAVVCVLPAPGLGYIIKALNVFAESHSVTQRIEIVCVETEPEIARKALQLLVWEPCSVSVTWLVGSQSNMLTEYGHKPHVILKGTPGYRANDTSYADVLLALESRPLPERPLRVLVPTPLYGGSLPIAFHCADALRELGHQVDILDLSPFYPLYKVAEEATSDARHVRVLQGMVTTYLSELISARAMDWNADLVWAVAQTPLTPSALDEMHHEGIHSAFWFMEDYAVFGYWRELAPHFDAVFTIQRGRFHESLRQLGAKHVAYLPCAANPAVHHPVKLTDSERERFGSAASFVGAGYPNRQNIFGGLGLKNLKIWGADWPKESAVYSYVQEESRRVTTEETAKIYSAACVNLNLHSSPHHSGINPDGDYVNPRTFEIAACNGFQLVDARSELASLFRPGEEITVFNRIEELPGLIDHYLSHPEESIAIAGRGRERVLSEHTYAHRMAFAVEFLEQRLPRLAARKRGPNYVTSLRRAAGDDQELLDFLAAFGDDEEVDLDKIVSRIELGHGELTRAEGIFLLMKEFRDWGREKGVIR
jgi:spore maturation protein CgeB